MKLNKYDNKCVKIITYDDEEFEGICIHNSNEYDEHEFGRNEESLQIENMLFYKSDIREIYSLENNNGPYGMFTDKYGDLEKETVEAGIDFIEDVLESEEEKHVYRLLEYLIDHSNLVIEYKPALIPILKDLNKRTTNKKIKKKTKELMDKII